MPLVNVKRKILAGRFYISHILDSPTLISCVLQLPGTLEMYTNALRYFNIKIARKSQTLEWGCFSSCKTLNVLCLFCFVFQQALLEQNMKLPADCFGSRRTRRGDENHWEGSWHSRLPSLTQIIWLYRETHFLILTGKSRMPEKRGYLSRHSDRTLKTFLFCLCLGGGGCLRVWFQLW